MTIIVVSPGSSAITVKLAGQVIVGGCVSFTVTVNAQVALFPAVSMTEQVTVVVPTGNEEPDGGLQVGVSAPSQLSVAVAVKLTTAEQTPLSLLTVIGFGQVMTGASVSFTVTVNIQVSPD